MGHSYRRRPHALKDVSFQWPKGFVALLGPNGAGKSTLLGLLVGDLRLRQGLLEVDSGAVGYVPQHADWPGTFTLREFLSYAAWWQGVPRSAWESRVEAALSAVNMDDLADERLGSLSGGQHRRAMVAQALVSDPSVLVLDEPTTGLDPRQRLQLRGVLADLARERSVIVATHLVEDVEAVADWVTMLDRGSVVHDGPMADVRVRWPADGVSALEAAYLELVR